MYNRVVNAITSSSLGPLRADMDEVMQALGPLRLPFDAVWKWHRDIAATNPDCVRLTEFAGSRSNGEAPVQALRIGDPETRENETVIMVSAANHGDEIETVDSARAIIACCIQNIDVLLECNTAVVVVPLAGGLDYRLNEGRLNTSSFADYLAGYARWAEPNLEFAFGDAEPQWLPVEVQKRLMHEYSPAAHVSLHSFLFVPQFTLAALAHDELASVQARLAHEYQFELLDELVEEPFTAKRAGGVFDYPDAASLPSASRDLMSGEYLRTRVPNRADAQVVLLDSTTLDLDSAWVESDEGRLLLERLAPHVDTVNRRLHETEKQRLSGSAEKLVLKAAQNRASVLTCNRDRALQAVKNEDTMSIARETFFVLRQLGLAGRALRALGEPDVFEMIQEEAHQLDRANVLQWKDARRFLGMQLGMTMAIIAQEISGDISSEL